MKGGAATPVHLRLDGALVGGEVIEGVEIPVPRLIRLDASKVETAAELAVDRNRSPQTHSVPPGGVCTAVLRLDASLLGVRDHII